MTETAIRPIPGHEPKRNKADLALFDRCNQTKAISLFDGELKPNIEERPERKPYTLERRKRSPKPFLSLAGEIVMRLRGGRGFTRIFEPWEPRAFCGYAESYWLPRKPGKMAGEPFLGRTIPGAGALLSRAPALRSQDGSRVGPKWRRRIAATTIQRSAIT